MSARFRYRRWIQQRHQTGVISVGVAVNNSRPIGQRNRRVLPGGRRLLKAAQDLLARDDYDGTGIDRWTKDPKTELQEWLQARKMKLPVYRVVATLGEAHKQTFDVECAVTELALNERGIGASRRAGEPTRMPISAGKPGSPGSA